MRKKQAISQRSGFTIVELLIVIVVIGILAAITIVSFNGVTARAENMKTISGVTAYAKAFSMYAIENGSYPSAPAYPCLGSPVSGSCARVVTVAGQCDFSGQAGVDTTFDALLAKYLPSKPAISEQKMNCGGSIYTGAYVNANSTNTKQLSFVVYLNNVTCPATAGTATLNSTDVSSNVRICAYNMPNL